MNKEMVGSFAWGSGILLLSGLVYTALFAFAPLQIAVISGCIAVIAGIAVTMGYCLALREKARTA